jgi:hypothetical protein
MILIFTLQTMPGHVKNGKIREIAVNGFCDMLALSRSLQADVAFSCHNGGHSRVYAGQFPVYALVMQIRVIINYTQTR